ncbi:MAG: N-acetyltransferase family protein [Granulosicoccus sp.]
MDSERVADLITRQAVQSDIQDMCQLLNQIIDIGGTTAYEVKLSDAEFSSHFLSGPNCMSLMVCLSEGDEILGFQALLKTPGLEPDWVDIATFARVEPKVKGVGTMLFGATLKLARESDIVSINATIRSDNTSGLAYYSKLGFVDYRVDKAIPLKYGTPVDRVSKKYVLIHCEET